MHMKTIFVPTDLSSNSYNALKYAIALAKQTGAKKIIVFHHNPQVYTGDIPVLYLDDLAVVNQELKSHLEKEIAKLVHFPDGAQAGFETEVVVSTEAGTVTAIDEHAQKAEADLIVIGSHGKTGLTRLVFGSVTAGVIETSDIPVLAIPEGFRYQPVTEISYASSLHHFQKELHRLRKFLGGMDASITVVHMRYPHFDNQLIANAKHLLQEEKQTNTNLEVIETTPEIRLVDNLVVYMRKKSPDWLVMFPEKRDWYDKIFLSSKTLELLSEFRRPLLVLHR